MKLKDFFGFGAKLKDESLTPLNESAYSIAQTLNPTAGFINSGIPEGSFIGDSFYDTGGVFGSKEIQPGLLEVERGYILQQRQMSMYPEVAIGIEEIMRDLFDKNNPITLKINAPEEHKIDTRLLYELFEEFKVKPFTTLGDTNTPRNLLFFNLLKQVYIDGRMVILACEAPDDWFETPKIFNPPKAKEPHYSSYNKGEFWSAETSQPVGALNESNIQVSPIFGIRRKVEPKKQQKRYFGSLSESMVHGYHLSKTQNDDESEAYKNRGNIEWLIEVNSKEAQAKHRKLFEKDESDESDDSDNAEGEKDSKDIEDSEDSNNSKDSKDDKDDSKDSQSSQPSQTSQSIQSLKKTKDLNVKNTKIVFIPLDPARIVIESDYRTLRYDLRIGQTITLDQDKVIQADFGLFDVVGARYGFLQYAFKFANQLQTLQDMLIPMRFRRSVARRVFNVDVGKLPQARAMEYMQNLQAKFKYKKAYDVRNGRITVNDKEPVGIVEDYWFANRDGGKGTSVDMIDEAGNFADSLEDILYFNKKLYQSMFIPLRRIFESEAEYDYTSSTIEVDELRFHNFLERIRFVYNSVLTKMFIKYVESHIQMPEELKDYISVNLVFNNWFAENKKFEQFEKGVGLFEDSSKLLGKAFSGETMMQNLFGMNAEEVKNEFSKIQAEIQEGSIYQPLYNAIAKMAEDDGY